MQKRKKIYSAISTSLILLGLIFVLQRQKTLVSEEVNAPIPTTVSPQLEIDDQAPSFSTAVTVIKKPASNWNQKTNLLIKLLENKNDNDPRYDSELKVLEENDKAEFRKLYHGLKPEKRNERGTIVFLLGRNIQSVNDLEFFREVITEPKCLSMTNCHISENTDDITLIYPQVMALRMLKTNASLKPEIQAILRVASTNPDPRISKLARVSVGSSNINK